MTEKCACEGCQELVELILDPNRVPTINRQKRSKYDSGISKNTRKIGDVISITNGLIPNPNGLCYHHRRILLYIIGNPLGTKPLFEGTILIVRKAVGDSRITMLKKARISQDTLQ